MTTTVEDVLTCPVCLSRFIDPRLLPCQHTFCLRPCLLNIYDNSLRTIRCPLCRETSRAGRGPEHLPRNLTVNALLGVQQPHPQRTEESQHPVSATAGEFNQLEESANRLRTAVPALLSEAVRLRARAAEVEIVAARQNTQVATAMDALLEQLAQRRSQLLADIAASSAAQLERLYSAVELLEMESASASSCCEALPLADASVEEIQSHRMLCEEAARRVSVTVANCSAVSTHSLPDMVINAEPASRAITALGRLRTPVSSSRQPAELIVANNYRTPLNPRHRESEAAPIAAPIRRQRLSSPEGAEATGRNGEAFISFANPAFRGNRRPPRLTSTNDGARTDPPRRAGQAAIHRQEQQQQQQQPRVQLESMHNAMSATLVASATEVSTTAQVNAAEPQQAPAPVQRSSTFVLSRGPRPVAFQISLDDDETAEPDSTNNEETAYLSRSAPHAVFGRQGSELGHLSAPRGIAACPQTGILFVADSNNHRLQAFSPAGQPRFAFGRLGAGQGEFECVTGVAVDAGTQKVFATDRYNHKVLVFDYQGSFVREFGSEGAEPGQFRYPWGAAVHNGRLYVADKKNHRVQVFDLDGRYLTSVGGYGKSDGQLDNPHFVCVRPDGSALLVSDSNNNRIQAFERTSGSFMFKFGSEGSGTGQMRHPRGVACDSGGRLIVVDSGNNRLQVYRVDGSFLCHWGTTGKRPGCFKGAEGVAALPDGRLAVTDRDNGRVQLF